MATTCLNINRINVVDNGVGFDEKYLNHIVQVFQWGLLLENDTSSQPVAYVKIAIEAPTVSF